MFGKPPHLWQDNHYVVSHGWNWTHALEHLDNRYTSCYEHTLGRLCDVKSIVHNGYLSKQVDQLAPKTWSHDVHNLWTGGDFSCCRIWWVDLPIRPRGEESRQTTASRKINLLKIERSEDMDHDHKDQGGDRPSTTSWSKSTWDSVALRTIWSWTTRYRYQG